LAFAPIHFISVEATMFAPRRFLAVLLVVGAACAQKTTSASTEATAAAPRIRKNPDVISQQELRDPTIAGADAMTAIRQLRPAFFRTRGPQSFTNASAGQVQVSQDYGPLQAVNALVAVDTRSLVEVRYLNANDAQNRFGINANGGPVIVVLTTLSAK
jgi:hypothetical protein